MTGGKQHVTDITNASLTMLFNIQSKCWDNELSALGVCYLASLGSGVFESVDEIKKNGKVRWFLSRICQQIFVRHYIMVDYMR